MENLIAALSIFVIGSPLVVMGIVAVIEDGKTQRYKLKLKHEKKKEVEEHD